jgi:apolipoprotein N-acyltransferase
MPKRARSSRPVTAPRARWHHRSYLLLLTILLLSLAFPPLSQFYLAWIAIVPWLLYIPRTRSPVAAFIASMIMGFILNAINMYWLWNVTGPGMVALIWYMALYWGVAAVVVRGLLKRFPPNRFDRCIILTAAIPTLFVSLELIRGNLWTGIPWLNFSTTQTRILVMCQIADIFGAYAITWWLVALNTLIALWIWNRTDGNDQSRAVSARDEAQLRANWRSLLAPTSGLAVLFLAIYLYGLYRLHETPHHPGPTVTVIQANFPQSNTGTKGATEEEIVNFHINETTKALNEARSKGAPSDLVVWSETMMPPVNTVSRQFLKDTKYGHTLQKTYERITALAKEFDTTILAGAIYYGDFRDLPDGTILPIDRRNVAFFFTPLGELSETRYDKIHLVPFGEFIPFKESVPFLYNIFLKLSPYDYDYTLQPGNPDALTVFTLTQHQTAKPTRFVVPICFEDLDAPLVARMFRGPHQTKRADMFVTITNDGWFAAPELYQHLATAQLRAIENHAPAARSVNTGLSGFIDSTGHAHDTLPLHVEGHSTSQLQLDSRVTLYTQFGDWFPTLCTFIIGFVSLRLMYDAARRPIRQSSITNHQ